MLGSSAQAAQTITIRSTDTGSKYEGVGAVSGGGGTSVLLHDYVEPQRSQILDYLFKPNYGAGIQELYVEIGGDGNSTQGSEPSHEHTSTDKNFNRGYEWWLMEQAKLRNPSIQLDVTAWSAPAWVGGGNFFSKGTTTYLADYIAGAKSAHGLDLNYVGCRNEKGIDENFLTMFRTTLNSAGLTTVGIHGFDNWEYATGSSSPWNWVTDLTTNATLAKAVYAVGEHTTWGSGAPPANIKAAAKQAGKAIWDTEEHVYEHGFQCAMDVTRAYLQNYIQSGVTKTIYWYLISAFYPVEPYYDITVGVASTPWSGAYTINPALWAYAHITQFAQPGWQFVDNASGALAGGGDYVTLLSPNKADFSVVADTYGATATQQVTFTLAGLSPASVNVWRSDANCAIPEASCGSGVERVFHRQHGPERDLFDHDDVWPDEGRGPGFAGTERISVPLLRELRSLRRFRIGRISSLLPCGHRRHVRARRAPGRNRTVPETDRRSACAELGTGACGALHDRWRRRLEGLRGECRHVNRDDRVGLAHRSSQWCRHRAMGPASRRIT